LIPDDEHHPAAMALGTTLRRPVVTSEFVVIEVGNFLAATPAREKLGVLLKTLRRDPQTTIIPASSELLQRGIALFLDRPDKSWSVTDCTSFEIMRDRGMLDAITTDHHLEQAGFRRRL
jgi:predicted nucleic acid-binding protein